MGPGLVVPKFMLIKSESDANFVCLPRH